MVELSAHTMKCILFIAAFVLELLYILMFVLTIRLPQFRFWPPPSHRSWQFFASWIMAGMVAIGFLCLGLLDYDTFVFHSQARFLLVLGLLIGSSILGTWAFFTFNLRTTIGLGDKLIIKGPYRYSRNPQYISDSLSIFAFMILTNSILVWILGFLAITLNILAPFTEEPWLEEKFGTSYLEYKSRVPRFIGLATRT